MSENKSRREFISQSGKMVTACALFGATGSVAYAADSAKPTCETGKPMSITAKHYYLDNVLLEAGFNVDGCRFNLSMQHPFQLSLSVF